MSIMDLKASDLIFCVNVRACCKWLCNLKFQPLVEFISTEIHFRITLVSTEPSLLGSGYPFVASPEFPPTNGTVAGAVPTVPGTPTTPAITPESWKTTNTGPQSLMKEPPIAVANRNATTQFATQGQQQAAVMMVYGLDNTTSNTDKLFNLVCLYGKLTTSAKQIFEIFRFCRQSRIMNFLSFSSFTQEMWQE